MQVTVLTLAAIAMLASGCTATTPTIAPTYAAQQVFHDAVITGADDLPGLDPATVTASAEHQVVDLVFDGLVTMSGSMTVEDWGASSIDVSPDGRTYTFHLRPSQFFSDGTPVQASDYAFGIDRALNPCLASPVAYYLYAIKDAERFASQTCAHGTIMPVDHPGPPLTTLIGDSIVPDNIDGMLTITLGQPAGYFLQALAYPTASAVEASVVGQDAGSEAWQSHLSDGPTGRGGSGMYYVASWDHGGGKLVLKQNPHWWGLSQGKKPRLTEIDVSVFADQTGAYNAYLAGQSDVGFPTAPPQAGAKSLPDEHDTPLLATSSLAMDWTLPPLGNLDARVALCLSIDRNALAQKLYAAGTLTELMPTWHIVPQGMPGYDPQLKGPDGVSSAGGNPSDARSHWQAYVQSLHGASPPTLTYYYVATSPWEQALGQALQQQWTAVLGVNVALQPLAESSAQLSPPALGGTQLHPSTWTDDYADPQDILSEFYASNALSNLDHVSDSAADTLMQDADHNPDQVTRLQEYQQAEVLLSRDVAVCPLFQDVERYLLHTWVHGWYVGAEGVAPNDAWVQTAILQH